MGLAAPPGSHLPGEGGWPGHPVPTTPSLGLSPGRQPSPAEASISPSLPLQPHPLQTRASPPTPLPRGGGGPCPCPSPNPGVGHTCSASSPATCHSTSDTGLADRQDKEISQCRQNLRQGLDRLTSLRSSNTRDGCQAVAGSLALCRPQLLGPGWVGVQGGKVWKCLHTVGAH